MIGGGKAKIISIFKKKNKKKKKMNQELELNQ